MNDTENHELIDIKILDRTYKVKCAPNEAQELQESVRYLDEQMRKVRQSASKSMNTDHIAVITALNISHELLLLKREQRHSSQSLKHRVDGIRERLKNFLGTEEEITV